MENKKNIIYICLVVFLFVLLSILKIYNCPLKYIFGLSCPTCGMTRAIIMALQFNFTQAFYYHMYWPVVVIVFAVYILNEFEIINIGKTKILIFVYIFSFLNIIYYFYRLFGESSIIYFNFTESLIYKIITICIN